MRKENRLQVFKDDKWQYVFCHNKRFGIITTADKNKALKGRDFDHFSNHFSNHQFKIK